jgi:hypothetical protein
MFEDVASATLLLLQLERASFHHAVYGILLTEIHPYSILTDCAYQAGAISYPQRAVRLHVGASRSRFSAYTYTRSHITMAGIPVGGRLRHE